MPWYLQILADQLTLYQPGGADYAYHNPTLVLAPPDFHTFLQPWFSLDVLWCQPIKLIQVVSTSEFHEY